jgi:hypothetical protein
MLCCVFCVLLLEWPSPVLYTLHALKWNLPLGYACFGTVAIAAKSQRAPAAAFLNACLALFTDVYSE